MVEAPQVGVVAEVAVSAPAAAQVVGWVAVAAPLVVVGQAVAARRAVPVVVALRVVAEAPAARVAARVERAAAADSTRS